MEIITSRSSSCLYYYIINYYRKVSEQKQNNLGVTKVLFAVKVPQKPAKTIIRFRPRLRESTTSNQDAKPHKQDYSSGNIARVIVLELFCQTGP